MLQTIRCASDLMRRKCYNSCIQPTPVWPLAVYQVKEIHQGAYRHSPPPHDAFSLLGEVHFNTGLTNQYKITSVLRAKRGTCHDRKSVIQGVT